MTVFLFSFIGAVTMLVLSIQKNQLFYDQLKLIESAKLSSIKF